MAYKHTSIAWTKPYKMFFFSCSAHLCKWKLVVRCGNPVKCKIVIGWLTLIKHEMVSKQVFNLQCFFLPEHKVGNDFAKWDYCSLEICSLKFFSWGSIWFAHSIFNNNYYFYCIQNEQPLCLYLAKESYFKVYTLKKISRKALAIKCICFVNCILVLTQSKYILLANSLKL